ncbi:hypothetical protein PIB30_042860 [Stylosanthes scabra]|uniref:Uncharacterized protein n=1 Tax=Stylosanthes scabra TaxID=79078 RepID=A0ABU6YH91_9FABA|nr:hypothetical protein [Stylosanthes scabra]
MDRAIKKATKKRRVVSENQKGRVDVDDDMHLNKTTKRRVNASKHPKELVTGEQDSPMNTTFSSEDHQLDNYTILDLESQNSVGFTTLLNSF